jgi:KaiC/GvpD/RAD55 family RecA-like ATPase
MSNPNQVVDLTTNVSRADAAVRLLATIMPMGRRGLAMAREAGLTASHFAEDDLRSIFDGLIEAEASGKIGSNVDTLQACESKLRSVGHWDEENRRTFASGSRWGPMNLAVMFTRVKPETAATLFPEHVVPFLEERQGPIGDETDNVFIPRHDLEAGPIRNGAADELGQHLERVIDGTIANVPFSARLLSSLTQALIPGTITTLVGDQGSGKTYFLLQELLEWTTSGVNVAVYFLEKDRVFYMRRLLAQLARNSQLDDLDYIKANPTESRSARIQHQHALNIVGKNIGTVNTEKRVTLDSLLAWIRQMCSAGKRILIIDPLTAASAGRDRWTADDDFVMAAQSLVLKHGASLILSTHAKKGNRTGSATIHDVASGAAYSRFVDTVIWFNRIKPAQRVRYITPYGPTDGSFEVFARLLKTRSGKGQGCDLAFANEGLRFLERGVVLEELRD